MKIAVWMVIAYIAGYINSVLDVNSDYEASYVAVSVLLVASLFVHGLNLSGRNHE